MPLKLTRPLVVFDLEATGIDTQRDRIVELAAVRITPEGTQKCYEWRINPEMPIPPGATAIHGITDADVASAPRFRDLVPELGALFSGVDLGGYNARRFDVPMLECEFARADVRPAPFEGALVVDPQEIFYLKEPRTLTAAVRYYCNEELQGAHGARADAQAAAKVLYAQLGRYQDLPRDLATLIELTKPKDRYVDPTRKLALNGAGEPVINFGQHKGARLADLAKTKRDYLLWMLNGEWHPKVIEAVKAAIAAAAPPKPPL